MKLCAPQSKFRNMLCPLQYCAPSDVTRYKCLPHHAPTKWNRLQKDKSLNKFRCSYVKCFFSFFGSKVTLENITSCSWNDYEEDSQKFALDINQEIYVQISDHPQDIKILGWCPAGPVLHHGKRVPPQLWLATLLVMVSQLKCLMGYVLHRPALHCIFSYWVD